MLSNLLYMLYLVSSIILYEDMYCYYFNLCVTILYILFQAPTTNCEARWWGKRIPHIKTGWGGLNRFQNLACWWVYVCNGRRRGAWAESASWRRHVWRDAAGLPWRLGGLPEVRWLTGLLTQSPASQTDGYLWESHELSFMIDNIRLLSTR